MQTTVWPAATRRLMNRGPMNPVPPMTRIGMPVSLGSGRQPVVHGAVVPEDLALALQRERQAKERVDGARELRVAVREIRRGHDATVDDGVDEVPHALSAAIDTD